MRVSVVVVCVLGLVAFSGCISSKSDVHEVDVHIGYTQDRQQQYVEPKEIKVKHGEKVRLVITNDDQAGASDSFHDIAFRYANYGLIEHEVPAGKTVKTCVPQAEPDHACPEGKDYFVASEKGRFKLYCEVGPLGKSNGDGTPQTRHEQMGMWATLVVE